MGVVPEDPRALTAIESHLAKSDPVLAAKFAAFAVSPSLARQSMRESARRAAAPHPSQRRRAQRLTVLTALACLIVMCITLSVLTAS